VAWHGLVNPNLDYRTTSQRLAVMDLQTEPASGAAGRTVHWANSALRSPLSVLLLKYMNVNRWCSDDVDRQSSQPRRFSVRVIRYRRYYFEASMADRRQAAPRVLALLYSGSESPRAGEHFTKAQYTFKAPIPPPGAPPASISLGQIMDQVVAMLGQPYLPGSNGVGLRGVRTASFPTSRPSRQLFQQRSAE
jgi:hypothetical protein